MGKVDQGTTQKNEQGIKASLEKMIYIQWWNDEMVWWCNGEMNPKWWNGDIVILWYRYIVISRDSISLGQKCNTKCFISLSLQ